jgi:septal ring factor EnvC (AmiA/AmiB activator)
VTARRGAAAIEEHAELEQLRARADRTGQEAAQTLAELAGRLAQARQPQAIARRLSARARHEAARAAKRMRAALAEHRTVKRAALAAVPVAGVLVVSAVAHRRGWLPAKPVIRNGGVLHLRRLPV